MSLDDDAAQARAVGVAQAIEDLVITVDLKRAELVFTDANRPDQYLDVVGRAFALKGSSD